MMTAGPHARAAVRLAGLLLFAVVAWPTPVQAQESRLGAEFRLQFHHLRETCGALKTASSCATTLVTGRPLRIVFGSIAPGNGPAFGVAYGTSWAPNEGWRLSWNSDVLRTPGGSWRAGSYLTFIHTPSPRIAVVTDPAAATSATAASPRPKTTINVYAQRTSVQDLSFFGLGPASLASQHASFGMTQGILGAAIVAPLPASRALNLSLLGDINARFVSLRDGRDDSVPSVFAAFDDESAPGLSQQPAFLQVGGGVRVTPRVHRYLHLDYLASAQHFTGGESGFTFNRWRLDLNHEIGLFRRSGEPDPDPDATNECLAKPTADTCLGSSRDLGGTIRLRALVVSSSAAEGSVVPFYFQPSMGGGGISGGRTLGSFRNYRFRAPHLLVFQQSFEHSIWGPLGLWIQSDEGMVAERRGALGLGGLEQTLTTGLTVRAGGAPALIVSYAVGGGEGRRVVVSFNAAILGGATRPSLD